MISRFFLSLLLLDNVNTMRPCLTEERKICQCTDTSTIAICSDLELQQFPIFEKYVRNMKEEIHAQKNNIQQWPNDMIMKSMKYLKFVDITENPLCKSPDLNRTLTIKLTACKYQVAKNLSSLTIKLTMHKKHSRTIFKHSRHFDLSKNDNNYNIVNHNQQYFDFKSSTS